MLTLATWVGAGLLWQWRQGVLSGRAFAAAPPRDGSLHLGDLMITLGAWLVGGAMGHLAGTFLVGDAAAPPAVLVRTLAGQAGMLPAIGYAGVRASAAVRGGIRGWAFASPVLPTLERTLAALLFVIPATLLTLTVGTWISTQLGHPPDPIAHDLLKTMLEARDQRLVWAFVVSAVVVAPLLEEIIFRGLVQTTLLHMNILPGRWAVVVASAALFAIVHFGMTWIALVGLFVLAMGMGYLYERTGSLWSCVIIHAAFNALNVLAIFAGWVPEAPPG